MPVNKKLRIGVVGVGVIADIHAQAIVDSNNATFHSAFSRTEKNVKAFGEKYNVNWGTDWENFISDPELDAVSICSPSGNHLDYGEKAAKAGKHVIVEKPIEVTLKRAKRLVNVCNESGVKLAVIFQSRFMQQIQDLKKKLDDNVIGDIFLGDAHIKWFRSQEYYDSGAWRGTKELDGGGALMNQSIHTIDLLQWLTGGVESLYGNVGTFTHERLEVEDNAAVTLRFKNGAIGVIEASTSVQPSQSRRIELHGTKGTAIIVDDSVEIKLADAEEKEDSKIKETDATGSSSPLASFSTDPHRDQFDGIAEAIEKNEAPPISGEESMKALAIVLAIYESSKTNQPIIIDEFIAKSLKK